MDSVLLALLFTLLVMALVLGYIMYQLSKLVQVDELNTVIEDVNLLGDRVSKALKESVDAIKDNEKQIETANKLYTELLGKNNVHTNQIANNMSAHSNLSTLVNNNKTNIQTLSQSLGSFVTPEYLQSNRYVVQNPSDPYIVSSTIGENLDSRGYMTMSNIDRTGFNNINLRSPAPSGTGTVITSSIKSSDKNVVIQPDNGNPNVVKIQPDSIMFENTATNSMAGLKFNSSEVEFCENTGGTMNCTQLMTR
jgi:hypothetical protein